MNFRIKDLEPYLSGITIVAKVASKSDVTAVRKKKYAFAIIEDETGQIKLNLWRDQVNQVEKGDFIRITKGFVHMRFKVKQVTTLSSIKKVDPKEYY